MAEGKFISYLRVSTARQGQSGLGLEAQRKAVTDYLNGGSWKLVREFVEVESGRNVKRPQLHEALRHCKMLGATLVVAKLDRLSRNAEFLLSLQNAGVSFVAADNPHANEMTVGILAIVAEYEAKQTSIRTRSALAVAAKTKKLGSPRPITRKAQLLGAIAASARRTELADEWHSVVAPSVARAMQEHGTLAGAAKALNSMGIPTRRGKEWTPNAVRMVMLRVGKA